MTKHALTKKQEAFCLAYAETGNATEAYRRAYNASRMKDESVHREAHELLKHPKITPRIERVRRRAAELANLTLADHLLKLYWLGEEAVAAGKIGAAVAAEVQRGKAAGLYDRKNRLQDPQPAQGLEPAPSDDEVVRAVLALLKGEMHTQGDQSTFAESSSTPSALRASDRSRSATSSSAGVQESLSSSAEGIERRATSPETQEPPTRRVGELAVQIRTSPDRSSIETRGLLGAERPEAVTTENLATRDAEKPVRRPSATRLTRADIRHVPAGDIWKRRRRLPEP